MGPSKLLSAIQTSLHLTVTFIALSLTHSACDYLTASVLTYIFMIDVNLPRIGPTASPRTSEFAERILARLRPLLEGDEEIQNHVIEGGGEGEQDERTQAIKLLKTGKTQYGFVYD